MIINIELGVRAGYYKIFSLNNQCFEIGIGKMRISLYGNHLFNYCQLYNMLSHLLFNDNVRDTIKKYTDYQISYDVFINRLMYEKRKHISVEEENLD